MTNIINYKKIMHSASLGAIRDILLNVSKNGLPGEHHFYITFDMENAGVETSSSIKEQYPYEMTIVIQNWYAGFTVTEEDFTITLNFSNVQETMKVPFSSIKSFVDPSVEFGLNFDLNPNLKTTHPVAIQTNTDEDFETSRESENEASPKKKGGEVVNLESFRKS
jgi:hypothetical protein